MRTKGIGALDFLDTKDSRDGFSLELALSELP
jgi:hypothetical protein